MEPKLSLVVSTIGRAEEIKILLNSLERQDMKDFEVLIVDQNVDERLTPVLQSFPWSFSVTHLRRPGTIGANRGRNEGWKFARGAYVLFPDDDCWYPPSLLRRGLEIAERTGADFVNGRAADQKGRNINGRFGSTAQAVTRANAWTSAIEWMMFIRRASLDVLGGFNEYIGPGASSPWQANEIQELILRALQKGMRGVYDPSLYGHHAEHSLAAPDEQTIRRGRAYARGMGYVLRASGYGPLTAGYWVSRATANTGIALLRGNFAQCRYYYNQIIGRLEGFFKLVLPL